MTDVALSAARWQRLSAVFEAAVGMPEDQRHAWLDQACADDLPMRQQIERMLIADRADSLGAAAIQCMPLAGDDAWAFGSQIGPYRVVSSLGAGGMGEVYLCERIDGAVTLKVAIKRLHSAHLHPELERRFLDERRFLARLQHPHIARFLDAAADAQGRPYAVMEYVQGLPITEYVGIHRCPLVQRLHLFLQVADAVGHAHRQLIVHRDIKPANVLVDAAGQPKLLDFGIAKAIDATAVDGVRAQHTAFEMRVFSLQHAAPEQLRGDGAGVSCDVYALGVLLYELLTGSPPLELSGLAYGEAERKIFEQLPAVPSRRADFALGFPEPPGWRRQLSGDLDRIVLHALKKSADERYPSVDALTADLRRHLNREPISLRGHHRWYRYSRFVGRHRLALALSALVLLSVVVSSGSIYWQSQQLMRERDQAILARARAESATGLLQRAFEGADPARNEGTELSARAVLEFAARDLAQRKDVDPAQRAALVATLASVRRSLGDAAGAIAVLDQTDAILAGLPAIDASQLHRLRADAQLDLGSPDDARRSLGEAQALLAGAPMRSDVDRELTRLGLLQARVYAAEGQPVQALEQLADLYRHTNRGSADALSLEVAEAYANKLEGMGRTETAAAINQHIIDVLAAPDADPLGRRVLGSLAQWHRSQGDPIQARRYADRYLNATRTLYGEHHRVYAGALDKYARIIADGGDLELADRQFQAALKLLLELGAQVSERTLCLAHNNYADFLLHRRQQPERAYQEAQRALQLARTAFPAGHLNIAFMASMAGESLLALNRADEAYALLLEAEAIYARFSGPEVRGVTRAQTQLLLAQTAQRQRNLAAARNWLQQAAPVIARSEDAESMARAQALAHELEVELPPLALSK